MAWKSGCGEGKYGTCPAPVAAFCAACPQRVDDDLADDLRDDRAGDNASDAVQVRGVETDAESCALH